MITLKFYSYFSHKTGKKSIQYDGDETTISEIFQYLCNQFPELAEFLEDENPEISVIADGKSLHLPKDLDVTVENELIISPIIAGGCSSS